MNRPELPHSTVCLDIHWKGSGSSTSVTNSNSSDRSNRSNSSDRSNTPSHSSEKDHSSNHQEKPVPKDIVTVDLLQIPPPSNELTDTQENELAMKNLLQGIKWIHMIQ